LYKILIENAFNPQSQHADDIEKYLETLLKAYEIELEAIRKRTKVNKINDYHWLIFVFRVYHQNA